KRTIATMIGRRWANREMYVLLACVYISLIVETGVGALPWEALLAIGTAPLARPIVRVIRAGGNPKKLNLALFLTAQLHMQFGAVLSVGLLVNWVVQSI
ncbi:MAG: 1,4-dihydroxy-2-naphthoate polyprenyltransferase, partial [Tepidiformaceae bacterium]